MEVMDETTTVALAYTVEIPDSHEARGAFSHEIEKLNKRARKLGVSELVTRETGKREYEEQRGDRKVIRRVVQIEVTGQSPRLAGWTFLAVLEHTPAGNILKTVPGLGELPERFRSTDNTCDHCQKIRQRKDTYIVRHDNGEHKQVGKSCLRDFLGHKSPEQIANWLFWVTSQLSQIGESFRGFGSASYDDLEDYLTYVAYSIRRYGWVSRTQANQTGKCSTADDAQQIMDPPNGPRGNDIRDELREYPVTDADRGTAIDAILWVRNVLAQKPVKSDYEHNLIVALAEDSFSRSHGVVASAIQAHRRALENELKTKEDGKLASESAYFGELKKRYELELQLLNVHSIEGDYGTTHIHKFVDRSGNRMTWFASNLPTWQETGADGEIIYHDYGLPQGAWYRIKATIKAHKEFKGVKETLITRAVVLGATEGNS